MDKIINYKTFETTPAARPEKFDNGTDRAVICWGDSITQARRGFSFPCRLEENLGGQYIVYNAGDAGETSTAIMSRAGVADTFLQYDIVFGEGSEYSNIFSRGTRDDEHPINTSKFTECWVKDAEGKNIYYTLNGNRLRIDNVLINGEKYELIEQTADKPNVWGGFEKLMLKRTGDISAPLTLKAGSRVAFDYSDKFNTAHCAVVLFGANDFWFDENTEKEKLDTLISRYKTVGETAQNALYVIPYFWPLDVTDAFIEAFGENTIDIRKYLTTDAFTDYSLPLTEQDKYWISKNYVPPVFWTEKAEKPDCHLNALGYKIIADLIYKQGVELGYWK